MLLLPFLPSCSTLRPGRLTERDTVLAPCVETVGDVEITYLGVSGLLIRHRRDVLLTSPFASNPGLLRVGLGLPIHPHRQRIDRHLPDFSQVDAVLVGHSHYDHLLDLAYLMESGRLPASVPVYGSATTARLLAPVDPDPRRVVVVEARAGDAENPGEWIRVGENLRFMALRSRHAPQFAGINLYTGEVAGDVPELPRTARGWKGGKNYAYLIDVLDGGRPAFRIHFQDAASDPPHGFPPPPVLAERPADLAVVCVAAFDQAEDYPEQVIRTLAPRHVLLTHWEDFFRDPDKEPKVVPGTSLEAFLRRLEPVLPAGAGWTLPRPGVTLTFPACAD